MFFSWNPVNLVTEHWLRDAYLTRDDSRELQIASGENAPQIETKGPFFEI